MIDNCSKVASNKYPKPEWYLEDAPDEDTLHGVSDELPLGDHPVPVLVTHAEDLLPTRAHVLITRKQYLKTSLENKTDSLVTPANPTPLQP